MPDDLTKKRPQDAKFININQPYEVKYWCEKLKTSKFMLSIAIKTVGPYIDDVETFLRKYR